MKTILTLALCLFSAVVLAESKPYAPEYDAMSWEILTPAAAQIDQATMLALSISNRSTHPLLLSVTPIIRRGFSEPGTVIATGADRPLTEDGELQLLAFDPSRMRCRGVEKIGNVDDYTSATLQLWPDEGYARIYEFTAQHVFFPDQHDYRAFAQYWMNINLSDRLWLAFPPGIADDGTWTRTPGPITYGPAAESKLESEVRVPLHRATGADLFTKGIASTAGKLELLLVFRDKPAQPGQRELFYLVGNQGDQKVFIFQDQLAAATVTPLLKPSSIAPQDGWPARDAFALEPGEYLSYRRELMTDPGTIAIQIPLAVTWGTTDAIAEQVLLSAELDLSEARPRSNP